MDNYKYKQRRKNSSFSMIPHWVIDQGHFAELSLPAKAIYLVIARHANYDSRNAVVSNPIIAKQAGLSLKSVVRAKLELVNMGLMKRWQSAHNASSHCHLIFDVAKKGLKQPSYKKGLLVPSYPNAQVPDTVLKDTGVGTNSTLVGERESLLIRDTIRDTIRKGDLEVKDSKPETLNQVKETKKIKTEKTLKSLWEIKDDVLVGFLTTMPIDKARDHLASVNYDVSSLVERVAAIKI